MQFYRVNKNSLEEVHPSEIRAADKPFYLFLGGLMHVNGFELKGGLPELLHEMTQASDDTKIYTVVLNDPADVARTAAQMYDYYKNRQYTPEAKELTDALFDTAGAHGLQQFCEKMNIVGYSYGTSLIQQVETCLREKVAGDARKLAALESVSCVDIGPAATPMIDIEGEKTQTPSSKKVIEEQGDQIRSDGRFRQVFFFRRGDKVMQDATGTDLFDVNDKSPHFSYKTDHLLFIGENCGDDMVRRIGVARYPSGVSTTRVDYAMNHEGHGLRVYTNIMNVGEKTASGQFATFPSSTLAPVIRETVAKMTRRGENAPAQHLQDWTQSGPTSAKEINSLHRAFNRYVKKFRENTFQQNFAYVEGLLKKLARKNGGPAPITS